MLSVASGELFVPPSVAVTVSSRSFCADGVSYSSSHVTSWPVWSTSRVCYRKAVCRRPHSVFILGRGYFCSGGFYRSGFYRKSCKKSFVTCRSAKNNRTAYLWSCSVMRSLESICKIRLKFYVTRAIPFSLYARELLPLPLPFQKNGLNEAFGGVSSFTSTITGILRSAH